MDMENADWWQWLTTKQAAAVLAVSPRTLRRMRLDGRLTEGQDYVVLGRRIIRYRLERLKGKG